VVAFVYYVQMSGWWCFETEVSGGCMLSRNRDANGETSLSLSQCKQTPF
jgi:hypothetical protein